METKQHFVLVDDEYINNKLCTMVLKRLFNEAEIFAFTDVLSGLQHIQEKYSDQDNANVFVFLDLKMPEYTGWDFLDRYEQFPPVVKQKIKIYILSSSISSEDMNRAKMNKNVEYYLVKPLTKESINLIMM